MNKKICSLGLSLALVSATPVYAASSNPKGRSTRVAVSQGISSPAVTSPVNFSHGFLYVNPAVAAALPSPYISLEGDGGNGNSDYGAELGIGNGLAGVAAGYIKNEHANDGTFGAIAGLSSPSVAGGLGYHEGGVCSVGAIIFPHSRHRIGLAADFGRGEDPSSLGAGYSYHSDSLIFALDGSRRSGGRKGVYMVTPGLELSSNLVSLSVSYDFYFYDGNRVNKDQIWFGLGFGTHAVHLAVYHDYRNDWSAALSFWM